MASEQTSREFALNQTQFQPDTARLVPLADGTVSAAAPVEFAFMAPRLQGNLYPDGRVEIALWGAGSIANLRVKPIETASYNYAPNRVLWDQGGLFLAQSQPVLFLKGVSYKSFAAARRCAWWGKVQSAGKQLRENGRRMVKTGWGLAICREVKDGLVLAAGATLEEAETALDLSVEQIVAECYAYVSTCDGAPDADPLVRSMISQSLHAGLSSIRSDNEGKFAGLAAGQAYSTPARTYYRDGYWTLQVLLTRRPDAIKAQIDILAKGLQPDGEAPSGVILTGPGQAEAWEQVRRTHPQIKEEHLRPGDWWSDHFDSPLFFVLTIADYVRATGDREPLEKHWKAIRSIYDRYRALDKAGNGLPVKPDRNDRDWADNVFRHGYVSYDIGLWIGALDAIAELGTEIDGDLAAEAAKIAVLARASLDGELLTAQGTYADYGTKEDFREDHLTLDSLTLLRFKAVSSDRAKTVLKAMVDQLETRNNAKQPYGDWGVMCAWPPFSRAKDTRSKSAFAYRYHNGSDWPYLSGLYAEQLRSYGVSDGLYAMTRWWQTCLERGWMGPVEYFAPPWGRGSLLQGWSSMAAQAYFTKASS